MGGAGTATCPEDQAIKTMKLYQHVERIYNEVADRGWGDVLDVDELKAVDRYDYADDATLDKAAHALGLIKTEGDDRQRSLVDVGSGIGVRIPNRPCACCNCNCNSFARLALTTWREERSLVVASRCDTDGRDLLSGRALRATSRTPPGNPTSTHPGMERLDGMQGGRQREREGGRWEAIGSSTAFMPPATCLRADPRGLVAGAACCAWRCRRTSTRSGLTSRRAATSRRASGAPPSPPPPRHSSSPPVSFSR